MTEDFNKKIDKYFPSYNESNEYLNTLIGRTSKIICGWFSSAEKMDLFLLMKILNVLCLGKMEFVLKIFSMRLRH